MIRLPLFRTAWGTLRSQAGISPYATRLVINVVLEAHDETCIECHNVDQRFRCPKRLALIAVMAGEPS